MWHVRIWGVKCHSRLHNRVRNPTVCVCVWVCLLKWLILVCVLRAVLSQEPSLVRFSCLIYGPAGEACHDFLNLKSQSPPPHKLLNKLAAGRDSLHHLQYATTLLFPECLECLSCPHASATACAIFVCVYDDKPFPPPLLLSYSIEGAYFVYGCQYFKRVQGHGIYQACKCSSFLIVSYCPHMCSQWPLYTYTSSAVSWPFFAYLHTSRGAKWQEELKKG